MLQEVWVTIQKKLEIFKLYTSSYPHHQKDIAGELYRGSYRSRGHIRAVPGRQLAVYSRGGVQRRTQEGGRRKKEDGRKLRNITTHTQSGGE